MSVLGNYEVHKGDHSCNRAVQEAIVMTKFANGPGELINLISGELTMQEIRESRERRRIESRSEELKKEIGGEER